MKTKKSVRNKFFRFGLMCCLLSYFTGNLFAQNVGINTTGAAPNAKALLDIDAAGSNPKGGLLVPRLTTAERNAITAPIPEALLIYNTTTKCFEAWNQTSLTWVSFGCVGCTVTTANAGTDITIGCGITTTTLAANTPSAGIGSWSVISGVAYITDPSSPTSGVTGLSINTIVILRWTVSNSPCPSSTDDVKITSYCFPCGSSLTDSRDGKTYPTVLIGSQCWMAKNLDYSTSGTYMSQWADQTNNGAVEKYYMLNDNPTGNTYGGLYQWAETVQYTNGASNTTSPSPAFPAKLQGICPSGSHVPTDAEWCTMENTVEAGTDPGCSTLGAWRGTNTGGKIKEAGTTHWATPNTGANNASGFTALGSGYRATDGSFLDVLYGTMFWTTNDSGTLSLVRQLSKNDGRVYRTSLGKTYGFPVRCILD